MKIKLGCIFLWLCLMPLAQADIAGKNVILIHGFNPFQLINPPTDNGQADAAAYWQTVDPAFKRDDGGLTNIIHWPSNRRLSGSGGIISIIQPQLSALLQEDYCRDYCVIVTHSTGDLVTRFLLKNKQSIFGSAMADRFKVAGVVDLAGAGGGTELANYGVGIANGINYASDIISALLDYAGFSVHYGLNVGVMNDLQPSVARNHATNAIPAIPRLRVAGTGDEFYGFATHPLIKGSDDSVVPLHSACGAASASSYHSCSRDTRIDGKLTYVSAAPAASDLYDFHYPILMSEELPHNSMQANHTGYWVTSVRSAESAYRNAGFNQLAVDIADYETREWWDFWQKYRYVDGTRYRSMSTLLVDKVFR